MATELFDLMGFVLELLFNWRFWVSLAIAAALALLVYKLLPGDAGTALAIAIAIAVSGAACGLRWQWSAEQANRIP